MMSQNLPVIGNGLIGGYKGVRKDRLPSPISLIFMQFSEKIRDPN